MDFTSFIQESNLILVPALYVLGVIIKRIPSIPDWIIPFVLLGVGIVCCVLLSFTNGKSLGTAIIQGTLVTGAAVLINQSYKQITKRDE